MGTLREVTAWLLSDELLLGDGVVTARTVKAVRPINLNRKIYLPSYASILFEWIIVVNKQKAPWVGTLQCSSLNHNIGVSRFCQQLPLPLLTLRSGFAVARWLRLPSDRLRF